MYGKRNGEKKEEFKPSLPLMIMGKLKSLANNKDELGVLTKTQW